MANNVIKRIWNQNTLVNIEALKGAIFEDEDGGHTFEISGVDNSGNAISLSGTVAGVFLRPDNTDVPITGSASGGIVSVTLPAECYDVPGRFGLTVFVTADSQKTCVYAAIGTVGRTSSGSVAPGTSADVVDLINQISAAVATIPASWSGLMADIAPTYSTSAAYPVGAYVYYNGDLYRCTTTITTGETWTAAHWTTAVLGNDVSDLKNAFNKQIGNTYNLYKCENKQGTINGVVITTSEIDNRITGNGTASANGGRTRLIFGYNTLPAGTYYFSQFSDSTPCVGAILSDANGNVVAQSGTSFTLASETDVYLVFNVVKNSVYNCELTVQITATTNERKFIRPVTDCDLVARDKLQYVTPQSFGAYGDGTHDDTLAIQDAVNANDYVFIPSGTYSINATGITVGNNKTIMIASNATLQMQSTNLTDYAIFIVTGNDVKISGGVLIGDRTTHVGTTEHGHLIDIRGSRVCVEGCELYNATGDGVYIGGNIDAVIEESTVKSCLFRRNGRNGISVINCKFFSITGNIFIGATGCIDVEPNKAWEKTIGRIVDNYSDDCTTKSLVSINYSSNVTKILLMVSGWHSQNDNISDPLFYIRNAGGGSSADGKIEFDNISVLSCNTPAIFSTRRVPGNPNTIATAFSNISISASTISDSIIIEQVDNNRAVSTAYDLFCFNTTYQYLAKALHPEGTTGSINLVVFVRGIVPSNTDVSVASQDSVNLYAMSLV